MAYGAVLLWSYARAYYRGIAVTYIGYGNLGVGLGLVAFQADGSCGNDDVVCLALVQCCSAETDVHGSWVAGVGSKLQSALYYVAVLVLKRDVADGACHGHTAGELHCHVGNLGDA